MGVWGSRCLACFLRVPDLLLVFIRCPADISPMALTLFPACTAIFPSPPNTPPPIYYILPHISTQYSTPYINTPPTPSQPAPCRRGGAGGWPGGGVPERQRCHCRHLHQGALCALCLLVTFYSWAVLFLGRTGGRQHCQGAPCMVCPLSSWLVWFPHCSCEYRTLLALRQPPHLPAAARRPSGRG